MKLVVIDDEEKVCRLICALIDWERLGIEAAGTAADGEDGLNLIRVVRPDILITDIRMPGKDGLELIAEAKSFLPHLQVIIISGYSQFDYAQAAIRYGVVNYLLKPVKKQELNTILEKITREHRQRLAETDRIEKLEGQVRQTQQNRQKEALHRAITDSRFDVPEDISLPLPCRIAVVKLDAIDPPYTINVAPILAARLEDHLEAILDRPYIFTVSDLFFILAVGGTDTPYGEALLGWCKKQVELFRQFTMTVAIGMPVTERSSLYAGAQSAFYGVSRRLEEGPLKIYRNDTAVSEAEYTTAPYNAGLAAALLHENEAEWVKAYTAFRTALEAEACTPYRYEIAIQQTAETVLEKITPHIESETGKALAALLSAVYCAPSRSLLWERFQFFLQTAHEKISAAVHEKLVRPVRDAQRYIAAHYAENTLSLNGIAEYVGLSSIYFSTLFKKSCGIGFAEYLQNVRMDHAKQLLSGTNRPIKEIAFAIGYTDPKHFAKVFKTATGVKPHEYRQLYE